MNLRLNNPPSFRKPMSVLVMGLPAVEAAQLPPLRSLNKDGSFSACKRRHSCFQWRALPSFFRPSIAHDFVLRVQGRAGNGSGFARGQDPAQGGFLVDAHALSAGKIDPECEGDRSRILGFRLVRRPRLSDGQCAFRRLGDSGRGSGRIDCGQGRRHSRRFRRRGLRRSDSHPGRAGNRHQATTWTAVKSNELEIHVRTEGRSSRAVEDDHPAIRRHRAGSNRSACVYGSGQA